MFVARASRVEPALRRAIRSLLYYGVLALPPQPDEKGIIRKKGLSCRGREEKTQRARRGTVGHFEN